MGVVAITQVIIQLGVASFIAGDRFV